MNILLTSISLSISILISTPALATIEAKPSDSIEKTCATVKEKILGLKTDPNWIQSLHQTCELTKDRKVESLCFESPDHLLYAVTIPNTINDRWNDFGKLLKKLEGDSDFLAYVAGTFTLLTPVETLASLQAKLKSNACMQKKPKICKNKLMKTLNSALKKARQNQGEGPTPD